MKYPMKKIYLAIIVASLVSSMTAATFTSCERNGEPSSSDADTIPSVFDNTQESTLTDEADTDKNAEEVEQMAYAAEIDKDTIMTFEIKADEAEWQNMLDNAAQEEYIPADITINGETIENVGIRPKGNSSLSSIARDSSTDRYSFKIEFDHYVDDQTWKGLDKIVINNMYSDSSYMKEYLSYDIMNYIGVDVPLYAFADIKVNGENWGFYLAIECYEESYIDRVFGGDGKLYKPESSNGMGVQNIVFEGAGGMPRSNDEANTGAAERGGFAVPANNNPENRSDLMLPPEGNQQVARGVQDIQQGTPDEADFGFVFDMSSPLDFQDRAGAVGGGAGRFGSSSGGIDLKYIDDNTESYSAIFKNAVLKCNIADYERVITALKNLNEGTELEKYVDVDATLRYFAAHTAVVSLDSYVSNMAHNYYLYENDGKVSILPWDYNMAFGGFQSGNGSDTINFPIDTPVSGVSLEDRPLIGKLLEVPEYLEKYRSYIAEILNGYFSEGKFEQKVEELDTLISEYVKNDPTAFSTPEQYEKAVAAMKEFGRLRAESIQGQLDGTVPSTTEAQRENRDKLIDASSFNMSDLGSMGGGRVNIRNDNGEEITFDGNMLTPEKISEAMEIIGSAENGVLSDEQRQKLYAAGFTDEQINQLMRMPASVVRGS